MNKQAVLNKGITLVALVITVIILIILASVSFSVLLGSNGLIEKSKQGATQYKEESIFEYINLAVISASTNTEAKIDENVLKSQLDERFGENNYTYSINEETGEVTVVVDGKEYKVSSAGKGNVANQDNESNTTSSAKMRAATTNIFDKTLSDYVTNGLLVWYDGINNTRAGNNPNATSWEDLSGNNNDAIFSNAIVANQSDITSISKGYYCTEENGYAFLYNDAYMTSTNNVGLSGDDQYTVEIVMNPWSDTKNSNYVREFVHSVPVWLGTTDINYDATMSFGYNYNTQKLEYFFINNPAEADVKTILDDTTFSVSYRKSKTGEILNGEKDALKIMLNDRHIISTFNGNTRNPDLTNAPVHIGREWQYSGNRSLHGSIQAIRIYNRVLTDAEVYQNYLADNCRYVKDIFVLNQENKLLYINTNGIKNIKYLYGNSNDATYIKNNGDNYEVTSNTTQLTIDKNGYYSFVFTDNNNNEIVKTFQVEGVDTNEKYRINNTDLTFDRIVRVGENEEFASIKDALNFLLENGYKEDGAIILADGLHYTNDIHNGNSYNINSKYNGMNVSIIAENPGSVRVTAGEMNLSEINTNYYINLKFYGIIFVEPLYGHGFALGGDIGTKEYYNCVFTIPVGGWNGNVSTATINTYNCAFVGGKNQYYSGNPLNGTCTNCASTDDTLDPANGTKVTCLENATFDSAYHVTIGDFEHKGTGLNPDGTQANIGVYGGEFSW